MKSKAIFPLLTWFLSSCFAEAADMGFIERFALSNDRAQILAELIPGTEDFYYFTCLYDQQTGKLDEVDALLKTWIERYGTTDRAREIQNRQALLLYPSQPEKTLAYLKATLGLEFNHQRQVPGESPDLPTTLDPALISREALLKRTLENPQYNATVQGFTRFAYDWLLSTDLDEHRLRDLLQLLELPDYPNLPTLIAKDLKAPHSSGFGSLPIHSRLTMKQLDELLTLMPELLDNDAFITAYIQRLQPGNDQINWRTVPLLYGAYLDRLCAFTEKLSAAHNSLRAHALYHRLRFRVLQGNYDKSDFEKYIQLPRRVDYIREEFRRRAVSAGAEADLSRDFAAATGLGQVDRDEPLVRRYLQHFFEEETPFDAFKAYIREDYLRTLYAETKLLQGDSDLEQWYSWLEPSAVEAIKSRVDVEFVPENKQDFAPDEPVKLQLWVKNVDRLLVRVFAIDVRSYYQQFDREVNTDIDLDGLVASHEDVYTYDDPPLKRVRRAFEFPAISGPGVWVIEFIGNGSSSRAVVQKGRLQYLSRTGAAGQLFTVFDEAGQKIPDASLWFSGQTYTADNNGEIAVPFSSEPGEKSIVLLHGDFATRTSFQHESENYQLAANFQVDTESIRAGMETRVAVRPFLYLNAVQMPLSFIKNPVLTIASQTHDGIISRQEIREFPLNTDELSVQTFRVPENLARIQFTLSGSVDRLMSDKPAHLSSEKAIPVNGINAAQQTASIFLAKFGDDYVLEMRDKTGFPLPDRAVNVGVKHSDFLDPANFDLKPDVNGRIMLGPLANIEQVTTNSAGLQTQTWNLNQTTYRYPAVLQASAGSELRIPYSAEKKIREEVTLLEMRGESYSADRSNMLRMNDGYLIASGLQPGDYLLHIKPIDQRIQIRITDGEVSPYYIASQTRLFRVDQPTPLQIQSVETVNDAVRITIAGTNEFTRVHFTATRFLPDASAFTQLSARQDPDPETKPVIYPDTLYQSGRQIGDEFQYILERRFADKFPGNMLERPSLILNPWSLKETHAEQQPVAPAAPPSPAVMRKKEVESEKKPGSSEDARREAPAFSPNFDFIGGDSGAGYNLKPDANGVVTVPLTDLHGRNYLHVVATDPFSTVSRQIALPEFQIAFRDLRLATVLDSKQHFIERKRVQFLDKDETLRVELAGDSDIQVYDTIPSVFALLRTLNGDPKLADFAFITRWPKLTPEEKREFYSKFASHELNFFLYNKDRAFFDHVVRPFIESKYAKTFMDAWLLNKDLNPYLEPWRFGQLNVVEKILLAQRVGGELQSVRRLTRESFEMVPPDPNRFEYLFMTALYGGTLASQSEGGLGGALLTSSTGERHSGLQNVQVGGSIQIRANYFSDHRVDAKQAENSSPQMQAGNGTLFEVNQSGPAPTPASEAASSQPADEPTLGRQVVGFDVNGDGIKEKLADLGSRGDRKLDEYRALYQPVRKTEEWVENNYYQLPIAQQHAGLIPINAFWADYAESEAGKPFRSTHLAEASNSFCEVLLALSVIDLPYEATKHSVDSGDSAMTVKAASPELVFYKDVQLAEPDSSESPILIGQSYFRLDDRYRFEGNQQFDKFVKDEFVAGVIYGCQITVTNPTSRPRQVELLHQIPQGALPVGSGRYAKSDRIGLEAYNTATLQFLFYFPKPGEFDHFPAHVSEGSKLLAFADPQHMKVVETPTEVDTESWQYISQQATDEQVVEFLNATNLNRVDLALIAWRLRDGGFYDRVLDILQQRHVYQPVLWSYAIYHNDPERLAAYLRFNDGFVAQTGAYFDGPLLTIDPIQRKSYQHVEYVPLSNPRAHQLNAKWTITNEQLRIQYASLMNILSHRTTLDQNDLLAVTYYLLLQDRTAEALEYFKLVAPDKLETQLQYDYFAAYLAFSQGDAKSGIEIALRYTEYPVARWQAMFADIRAQGEELGIAESTTAPADDRPKQDKLASQAPRLELQVKDETVVLHYTNLKECQVSLYPIDLEMLFTRNPFELARSNVFAGVKPAISQTLQLDSSKTQMEISIDPAYVNAHVVIKADAAGISRSDIRYASTLVAQLAESYAQVQVSDKAEKPLPKVYVKIFARMRNGEVLFYRDGYTDLRGRFDYASSSTLNVGDVSQFAILVLSDDHGAEVLTAEPPAR